MHLSSNASLCGWVVCALQCAGAQALILERFFFFFFLSQANNTTSVDWSLGH